MQPLSTQTGDEDNSGGTSKTPPESVTIVIDGDKVRFWRRFWQIFAIFLVILFIIIIIIIATTLPKDKTNDTSSSTPSPTIEYLDSITFPSSNKFRIESYNNPTGTKTSIISKPRAIRSAYYNGSTILYVGSSAFSIDQAFVMIDYNSDGINDAEFIIFESSSVSSTYSPASLAISNDGNNNLYISLTDMIIKCDGNIHEKVLSFTSINDRLSDCNKILDIPLTPEDASKSWNVRRYIGISPQTNTLCIANGMTCDECAHESVDITFPHGTITCFNDLSNTAMMNTNMSDINDPNINVIADGVRNSVGFDWNPINEAFYFTDNGRDEVHDNYPDDELNYVSNNGLNHFGFPQCHSVGSGPVMDRSSGCSESFIDPNITISTDNINCSKYSNSIQPLGPHVVPLGMRFYSGNMFPTDFTNTLFIAQRGSPDYDSFGYRIVVVKLDDNNNGEVIEHEIFAQGWYDYDTDTINGRLVDVEILHDGSMVVSDDYSDEIYRITYIDESRDEIIFNNTNNDEICNYSYVTFNLPFKVNLPSNDFSIAYYTLPKTSIISQPRTIRSAYYKGATLVYAGGKQFLIDRAYVMIDYESDGVNDVEFIVFESSSIGSTYSPTALAILNNDLYISLADGIIRCDNANEQVLTFTSINDRLSNCNKILNISLTPEGASRSYLLRRYIGVSSQTNTLCMANGITCDNCAHESVDISFPHSTITCFNDLSVSAMGNTNMSNINDPNINTIADGVRNSVGFDFHPITNGFYFTDNGRDEVHEYYPDDELDYVSNKSFYDENNILHFGFPECHSLGSGELELRDINCHESFIDPNISITGNVNCSIFEDSLQPLGAHVVPLGMRFYSGNMFPTDYINTIFIAQRGNGRSDSLGHRIAVVKLSDDGSKVIDHEIFANGWFNYDTNTVNGRPIDVAILNDGSLLLSDDNSANGANGAIYRITFNGNVNDKYLNNNTTNINPSCNFSYAN